MNRQQLFGLSKNNLFTICLHTHTHSDFPVKEKQTQLKEILSCKKFLISEYGIEGNQLAYAYGRYDNNTIKVVRELQLSGCFTTEAIHINENSDLAKLGRFQVYNWDIETFKEQLNAWSNS